MWLSEALVDPCLRSRHRANPHHRKCSLTLPISPNFFKRNVHLRARRGGGRGIVEWAHRALQDEAKRGVGVLKGITPFSCLISLFRVRGKTLSFTLRPLEGGIEPCMGASIGCHMHRAFQRKLLRFRSFVHVLLTNSDVILSRSPFRVCECHPGWPTHALLPAKEYATERPKARPKTSDRVTPVAPTPVSLSPFTHRAPVCHQNRVQGYLSPKVI